MSKFLLSSLLLIIVIQLNRAQTNSSFGKYYKISNYGIQVPFAKEPIIIRPIKNALGTITTYLIYFKNTKYDPNLEYGIELIELNPKDTNYTEVEKVEQMALNFKALYQMANQTLINEEKSLFNGKYCKRLKYKYKNGKLGEGYRNSLIIAIKNCVIEFYVFTPQENDNNPKINEFFEAILIK
jgi:hypothetical protein